MIRKYIIIADDSIKGFDEEIARLKREWGAEEIEPCDDCISREDALEEAYEFFEIGYNGKGIFRRLKELPSVTPQPKTGRWIIDINGRDYCSCSECKHRFDVDHLKFSWDIYDFPPYCPNCGAKMEVEE